MKVIWECCGCAQSAADLVNDLWQKQQMAQMRTMAQSTQVRNDECNARLAMRVSAMLSQFIAN